MVGGATIVRPAPRARRPEAPAAGEREKPVAEPVKAEPAIAWTRWSEAPPLAPFDADSLAETLDGGQAFRWRRDGEVWTGVWGRQLAQLRLTESGRLQFRAPKGRKRSAEAALASYLRTGWDWPALSQRLPAGCDPTIAAALARFPGLRLLDQPFGETLLCFLCSPMKRIDQIKALCERLANRFGEKIATGVRALPDWGTLSEVDEAALRELGLGYRAKGIRGAAIQLAARPGRLEEIAALPYPQAKQALRELPGVGEKIADCALLFGAGKLEAFPVDTWILKVLRARYGLDGWTVPQLARFGRAHFGPLAGYAQQFLFAHERRLAAETRRPKTASPEPLAAL